MEQWLNTGLQSIIMFFIFIWIDTWLFFDYFYFEESSMASTTTTCATANVKIWERAGFACFQRLCLRFSFTNWRMYSSNSAIRFWLPWVRTRRNSEIELKIFVLVNSIIVGEKINSNHWNDYILPLINFLTLSDTFPSTIFSDPTQWINNICTIFMS